jgi:signal transduction histidine kinase
MARGRLSVVLATAGLAVGIAAEAVTDGGLAASAADLGTGWTVLACGLWGWCRRPDQLRWPALALAGIAWFAGNFAAGAALIYLHRGPLVNACVAGARSHPRRVAAAVAAGYVDALVTGAGSGALTLGVAVLVATLAVPAWTSPSAVPGRLAAGSRTALAAGLALAGATAIAGVSGTAADATLYAYEAAVVAAALLLAAVPGAEARARETLADLVVEIGPARRAPTTRRALARALGDPSLQVGYRLAGTARYVDRDGRPVELPRDGSRRAATMVEREGEPIAVLVHDAAALDDPSVVDAVREATALVLANARLEADVGTQLGELRASRERIVEARDEQRRLLARRLRDGSERRLGDVAEAVGRARAAAPGPEGGELLDLIDAELERAREELRELARGIHPRVLTERGLSAALEALAERAPVPVAVVAPQGRLPGPVEAAAYFLCSEALTNVAKYAHASAVRCEVALCDDHVAVSVVDDGAGGAEPGRGSGLRGLADRIDALGGRFEVTSPAGGGTTVRAELPLPAAGAPV